MALSINTEIHIHYIHLHDQDTPAQKNTPAHIHTYTENTTNVAKMSNTYTIVCAFGRQSNIKHALQFRPAIELILPRKNNSTFISTIVNPVGSINNSFREKMKQSCNGTEPSVLLFGDSFSMSPMLKHHLLIEEYARHSSEDAKQNWLKSFTRCLELVRENEPFVAFRILRIFEASEQIPWTSKSITALGFHETYINTLSPRNKLKKTTVQKIKKQVLALNFFDKTETIKNTVYNLLHQAGAYNTGQLRHRLMEAMKMHNSSETYLKLAVFFLPKYMKYLVDKRAMLDKCLHDLQTMEQPDLVLYEKYPTIWSKLPWVDQVEDTIKFWKQHEMFQLEGWETRFDTYKKVFEARQIGGETVAAIDFELQHIQTIKQIIDPDIPRTYNYAFKHEYDAELGLINFFQKALQKESVSVELGYQLSDLQDAVIIVPNLSLKRYAALLCNPTNRRNIKVYDKNIYNPWFGNKAKQRFFVFGLDLWAFQDIRSYLEGICVRKTLQSNVTLHAFADINISYFAAPRFGFRPWNSIREASWFPKIEATPKSAHLHADEIVIKDIDTFLKEKILDENIMHKKDRLSAFHSYVFMTFSEDDRQLMVEELSRNDRLPNCKLRYHVGDRVQTPDGFLTNIKQITHDGKVSIYAWKDNYEQFMVFLENPFHGFESLCYHPTELRDAFVMRFHWLCGPLSNVVLCGSWPVYAVEEVRKLCTRTIYFHPEYKELAWQQPQHPRKNCFHSILHEQEMQRNHKRQAEQEAEDAARQAAKKQRLQDVYNRSKELARAKQNLHETASLSSENL